MDIRIIKRMKRIAYSLKHPQNEYDHRVNVRRAWKFINEMCMRDLDFQLSMRFIAYVMKYH